MCNLGNLYQADWDTSKRTVIFSHYHENLINLTNFSYSTYIVTSQKMAEFISITILCNTTGGKTYSPKPVWECSINQKRITVIAGLWHLIHKNVYFAAVRRKYRRRCNSVTCTSSVKGNIFVFNMVIAVLSSHGNRKWKLWSSGMWCCIAWWHMTF